MSLEVNAWLPGYFLVTSAPTEHLFQGLIVQLKADVLQTQMRDCLLIFILKLIN